uniref:Uncharacterized protein n=1 Tax=Amphimedon queenslandica TaxID=400682 RepID=A0A1X7T0U3_AMPQE
MYTRCVLHGAISSFFLDSLAVGLFEGFPPMFSLTFDPQSFKVVLQTFSQKLSELAQHVDFREERADDDNDREEGKKKQEEEEGEGVSGPTTKKPSHRWPWEFTYSKLKQALTEVSVLFEVLQIVHNHHQYLSLDPVYVNKKYTLPPSYQYQIKKK